MSFSCLDMEAKSVSFLAALWGFICISRFSAISKSSIKSFGRLCCRCFRSTLVKLVPSCSSKSFEREKPGGVMSAACGFSRKILSSSFLYQFFSYPD